MICDHINKDLENAPFSPELKDMLAGLLTAVRSLGTIQGHMLPNKPTFSGLSYANVTANSQPTQNIAKKTRNSEPPPPPPHVTLTSEDDKESENDAKYYKFVEIIKEAEKSTLIFNLDLGKTPIMNQDTMSTRASLALSKMAAKQEKGTTSIPSEEARETLDDALGMAKGITFYGKQTKTYTNPKDSENSGAYCTLPVRYDFKDRDTRSKVENFLREKCGVQCSTPYPTMLRECIKQTVEKVKTDYPGSTVRVNVDAKNFCLRVSKKAKDEANYTPLRKHLPLPVEALDTSSKKIPDGFKFNIDLNPSPPRPSRRDTHEQTQPDTSETEKAQDAQK